MNPMPPRIQARPKDHRGYPITYVTAIFEDGRADFTTLDEDRVGHVLQERLCGICAQPHENLVAGIATTEEVESGIFRDPPMHVECAEYALRVCPFLADHNMRYMPAELKPEGIALLGPDFIPTEVNRVAVTEKRERSKNYEMVVFENYTFGRTARRNFLWKGLEVTQNHSLQV